MKLYVFSAKLFTNIRIGFEKRMWAVSDKVDDQAFMLQRFTKSRDMLIGSFGLLYCSESGNQCFTMPFTILSQPEEPTSTISDVWPQVWGLPFKINPLGPPERTIQLHAATNLWPIFRNVETPDHERVNAPARMKGMNGRLQFLPNKISEKDWFLITRDLGYRDNITSNLA